MSTGRRSAAAAIDVLLPVVVASVAPLAVLFALRDDPEPVGLSVVVSLIVMWLTIWVLAGVVVELLVPLRWDATPGERWTGLAQAPRGERWWSRVARLVVRGALRGAATGVVVLLVWSGTGAGGVESAVLGVLGGATLLAATGLPVVAGQSLVDRAVGVEVVRGS